MKRLRRAYHVSGELARAFRPLCHAEVHPLFSSRAAHGHNRHGPRLAQRYGTGHALLQHVTGWQAGGRLRKEEGTCSEMRAVSLCAALRQETVAASLVPRHAPLGLERPPAAVRAVGA